jgi:nucleotide-binding universal stress UspA family protein
MTAVLFTYDGSEQSRRALRYAERLTTEDSVSVISVAIALLEGPRTAAYTDPTSDPSEHRRQLDEALTILEQAGVRADPIAAIGNPAHEIITAAESRGVDVIVIGSQGMSAVRRFLLGSVVDRVVRHATCDVLVVR